MLDLVRAETATIVDRAAAAARIEHPVRVRAGLVRRERQVAVVQRAAGAGRGGGLDQVLCIEQGAGASVDVVEHGVAVGLGRLAVDAHRIGQRRRDVACEHDEFRVVDAAHVGVEARGRDVPGARRAYVGCVADHGAVSDLADRAGEIDRRELGHACLLQLPLARMDDHVAADHGQACMEAVEAHVLGAVGIDDHVAYLELVAVGRCACLWPRELQRACRAAGSQTEGGRVLLDQLQCLVDRGRLVAGLGKSAETREGNRGDGQQSRQFLHVIPQVMNGFVRGMHQVMTFKHDVSRTAEGC